MNTLDKEGFKVALRSVDRMKDLGRGESKMETARRARSAERSVGRAIERGGSVLRVGH